MNKKFIAGIDEAGRGPLAGPVVIGAVAGNTVRTLKNIRDSKKLSAKKREIWQRILKANFQCRHIFVGPKVIDKIGISKAVHFGVKKVLKKFSRKIDLVLLDGSLKAPQRYKQKTIIK